MWSSIRDEFAMVQWATDALVVALNYGTMPQAGRDPRLTNLEWNIMLDELDVCCCEKCTNEDRCRRLWDLLDEPRRGLVRIETTISYGLASCD